MISGGLLQAPLFELEGWGRSFRFFTRGKERLVGEAVCEHGVATARWPEPLKKLTATRSRHRHPYRRGRFCASPRQFAQAECLRIRGRRPAGSAQPHPGGSGTAGPPEVLPGQASAIKKRGDNQRLWKTPRPWLPWKVGKRRGGGRGPRSRPPATTRTLRRHRRSATELNTCTGPTTPTPPTSAHAHQPVPSSRSPDRMPHDRIGQDGRLEGARRRDWRNVANCPPQKQADDRGRSPSPDAAATDAH